jgi:hypothetical protein
MKPEAKILLDEHKGEFENYKSYLDANDWFDDVDVNMRTGKLESTKLKTEVSIIDTIIKSTTKFKEDVGEDIDKKPIQDFIKFTSAVINKHIDRIALYKRMYPLDSNSVESEVEFHSDLFALITKTKVALSKLKIDENELSRKSIDLFFGDTKAPLMMREFLCDTFQIINDKTANLDINFSAFHVNPATSTEMFINMKEKDIPKWDENKHFFEQELSTIQFWEEERRKMMYGVNINGYHISDWLYWHLNHFKLSFGAGINKKISQPFFRDNEYFLDQMSGKADLIGNVGVLMYGTRRWSKSVGLSSKITHKLTIMPKAQGTIQGYSEVPDLKAIIDYISDAVENMHPALRIPANSMDLKNGAILGLKGKKVQERYDFSRLSVVNLEGGNTKKGGQKTAGSTPDIFVFDEIAKGDCITPWQAAIPSFAGGGGNGRWRLVPYLAATAGDAELSKDAEKMLKNPEVYSILPMDWDMLEDFVDPDYVTWKRNSFGFFLPAQQSLMAPDKKIITFQEFLGSDNDSLSNIVIHNTDWKAGKEFFEEERNKKSADVSMLATYTNSFPLDPEDCYLTTEINIFPGLECKKRKSFIESEGIVGEKYKLWRDSLGEFRAESDLTLPLITDYPYEGKSIDAAVVMLENPLLQNGKPPLGLYVIGFDDVKHDKTDGDSVMSACVFKRSYEGGEWANRVVAWYDSRPDRKKDYYKNLYYLMKIFNARLLHENADNGFIEYLEDLYPDDLQIHVSRSVSLASEENVQMNHNRPWGWAPTPHNIYHANTRVVRYTKEDKVIIGERDDLSGVDRLNHPMLLEELYKYKNKQNADRIRSFSLALTLAQYYDRTYQYMKVRKTEDIIEDKNKSKKHVKASKGLTDTSKLTKW